MRITHLSLIPVLTIVTNGQRVDGQRYLKTKSFMDSSHRFAQTVCTADSGCGSLEYCAAGTCRRYGSCGSLIDCKNPSNQYLDRDCTGVMTCPEATGRCTELCTGFPCPNNKGPVQCLAAPCSVTKCDKPYVSCVDDYCDGCNAIFFNAAGERVCFEKSCSADKDCASGSEYCLAGKCRKNGTCETSSDCKNPANKYPAPLCVGQKTCDNGFCNTVCGSACPDGKNETQCLVEPCKVTGCREPYISCVNDYCGGCNALFYNASGVQVCKADQNKTIGKTCTSDANCTSSFQFCSAGKCRDYGTCGDVTDCVNPSNEYLRSDCLGFLHCTSGKCGKFCNGSKCPNNVTAVECINPACNATKCDASYTHCVEDTCGSCKAVFFNATGHQTCLNGSTGSSGGQKKCQWDQDCDTTTQYCSRDGICRPVGKNCQKQLETCNNQPTVAKYLLCVSQMAGQYWACRYPS